MTIIILRLMSQYTILPGTVAIVGYSHHTIWSKYTVNHHTVFPTHKKLQFLQKSIQESNQTVQRQLFVKSLMAASRGLAKSTMHKDREQRNKYTTYHFRSYTHLVSHSKLLYKQWNIRFGFLTWRVCALSTLLHPITHTMNNNTDAKRKGLI